MSKCLLYLVSTRISQCTDRKIKTLAGINTIGIRRAH